MGGIFGGIAQGMQAAAGAKEKAEERKLQKQILQAQMSNTKLKEQQMLMKQKAFEWLFGGETQAGQAGTTANAGGQTTTPMGESIQPKKSRLTEVMSDPNKMMAFQMLTGENLSGLAGLASRGNIIQAEMKDGSIQQFFRNQMTGEIIPLPLRKQPPLEGVNIEQAGRTYRQWVNPRTQGQGGQQALGPNGQAIGAMPGSSTPGLQIKERKALPAENAAKLQMAQGGLQDLMKAKDILMPNGKPDYVAIGQMTTRLPWTKGREAYSYLYNALEGKIRMESGAAIPHEEIVRMALRLVPSMLDRPGHIQNKMEMAERFLRGTIEKMDPNKAYTKDDMQFTGTDGQKYVWKQNYKLSDEKAQAIFQEAGGDPKKARQIAEKRGYKF